MNPQNDLERGLLFRAMKDSYRSLAPFRNLTRNLVEEYTGPGYGGGTRTKRENLVGLMSQAVDAYTMSLAANRPRVLASTRKRHLVYFAKHFQEAVNNLIEEIGLEYTIRTAVLDTFFSGLGIVKIYMADSAPVQLEEGTWMDPGQPFAANVSLDNYCFDMSAQRFDQVKYAADSYRISFSNLKKGDFYNQKVVAELVPTSKHDTGDQERLEKISRGDETDHDEFEPMIDVMDVWMPQDGRIDTYAMDATHRFTSQHPPVAQMDWDGSEHGPYRMLSFSPVPENIMPSSPASHLSGLARLTNSLMRQQARQARRQKDIYTYTPAGSGSAKKMQRTPDGHWVEVQDGTEVSVIKMGGVDQSNHAFMLGTIQMFDRMAGNLSAKLGLGPQSDTVGQEKLIHGAVSSTEAHLQDQTIDFARGIIRDLGKMLWDDEVKVLPGRIPLEGAPQYSADATWYPGNREGEFYDYDLEIDVFSMPYQSPAQRVQSLNQLLAQIYIPMGQQLAMQGGTINLQALTEIYAELMNLPRLKDVIQFSTELPEPGGPQRGGKASHTTREYIRKSVPTGGTMQGRQHVEQQAWLDSGQNNQDQAASLSLAV